MLRHACPASSPCATASPLLPGASGPGGVGRLCFTTAPLICDTRARRPNKTRRAAAARRSTVGARRRGPRHAAAAGAPRAAAEAGCTTLLHLLQIVLHLCGCEHLELLVRPDDAHLGRGRGGGGAREGAGRAGATPVGHGAAPRTRADCHVAWGHAGRPKDGAAAPARTSKKRQNQPRCGSPAAARTSMLCPDTCPSKPSFSVSSAVWMASSMPTCRGERRRSQPQAWIEGQGAGGARERCCSDGRVPFSCANAGNGAGAASLPLRKLPSPA
jgi:hypothetical protein